LISSSKFSPWCSAGNRSFIFLTKSGLAKSGLITSAVMPRARSTCGPEAAAAAPEPAAAGIWMPERMFCRSDSWIGAEDEADRAAPPAATAAGAAGVVAAAAAAVEEGVLVVAGVSRLALWEEISCSAPVSKLLS
jgi:hypothetical protein